MASRLSFALFVLLVVARPSGAQSFVQPVYPEVTAAGREWLRDGDPIAFANDDYWPAGVAVFFNPDVMVVTGSYDGVPLFADTSRPPYDQVLVPMGGNLLKPYERLRRGVLAGTTGGTAPSYPTAAVPYEDEGQPWPQQSEGNSRPTRRIPAPPPQPAPPEEHGVPFHLQTARTPAGNRGIWIRYEGARWESAGEAVEYDAEQFWRTGTYQGFPVFRRKSDSVAEPQIFIPVRDDLLAPYKKATDGA